jgi:hypothetical protein
MLPTGAFKQTVQAWIARDPDDRKELLREGGCLVEWQATLRSAVVFDRLPAIEDPLIRSKGFGPWFRYSLPFLTQSSVNAMRGPASTISKSDGRSASRSRGPSRPAHLAAVKRSLLAVSATFPPSANSMP